jgi:cytosine/adenosine deaminase-related metal-dependent hydrolase
MILNNTQHALTNEPVNIRLSDGKISRLQAEPFDDTDKTFQLDLTGTIIFPGLINSHDHPDFNLFPALSDKHYRNYTEWGGYIHKHYKDKINEVLRVPLALREQWGLYKNLLCGVTTVVNHGEKLKKHTDIINVYEDSQSIHSASFEKKWKLLLNNPLKKNKQVTIHTGEGVDIAANKEIDKLIGWNLFKRELMGIHGIAMDEKQAKSFKALVWCPGSNFFLFGQTARIDLLKKHVKILFGTDSTLTGSWNIWEHIRLARSTGYMSDPELYDALTTNAADVWNMNCGEIAEGRDADLVVARRKGDIGAFFGLDPEDIMMVMSRGHIRLFDEELYPQLKGIDLAAYSRVYIDGTCKYVTGDLPELIKKIRYYYPAADFPVI